MSDAFDGYKKDIERFRANVKFVNGACGFVVAIGEKIMSIDVFDKPSTCQKVWDRVLSGVVFDALKADKTEQRPSVDHVEKLISDLSGLPWEKATAIGEGEEFRAESTQGDHASALTYEQNVLHGSVVAAP